jgi:hypothetical protein
MAMKDLKWRPRFIVEGRRIWQKFERKVKEEKGKGCVWDLGGTKKKER